MLQSNSAGDNIHVIDPATNKVVGTIEDIEVPHGFTISPDGGASTSPMKRCVRWTLSMRNAECHQADSIERPAK